MVKLHSYKGGVVETATKWLFYVCKMDRGGQKESIMDEYPREPEKERDGAVPLLASSMFA